MGNRIKVLTVGGQFIAKGISSLLSTQWGIDIIGSSDNPGDIHEMIQKTMPNVVLIDLTLGEKMLELIDYIKEKFPAIGVLVFPPPQNVDILLESIYRGANGFIPANVDGETFAQLIRKSHADLNFVDMLLSKELLQTLPHVNNNGNQLLTFAVRSKLTKREWQILELVSQGLSNEEIADRLCIAHNTVRNHVSNTMNKLEIHKRVDLVLLGVRMGIFSHQ